MRRFTEAEIIEVWDRRQAGELTRSIARRLGRNGSSIRRLFEDTGGVRPAPRRRAERHLTLVECEEISRGVAGGESLRLMAWRLGRAPSTISRELARNGGRRRYRAHRADRAAWGRARRPKACKLATSRKLRLLVEDKLADWWSPTQISRWLARTYPATRNGEKSVEQGHSSIARGALRVTFDDEFSRRLRSETEHVPEVAINLTEVRIRAQRRRVRTRVMWSGALGVLVVLGAVGAVQLARQRAPENTDGVLQVHAFVASGAEPQFDLGGLGTRAPAAGH